ncbi:hypothetical protein [Microbacterium album]|uniref:Uncharacterized protein n=1 Tax=Microbacterium album TaxID=2053191 RepID=A0A917IDK4_9MICO|nr:hypothetical protein [Microbacterium album]GGH37569.1 hypothetical protein GCM10010921_07530 [Microbacterium album]
MSGNAIVRLARDTAILLGVLWVAFIALQWAGAAVPDRAIAQQLTASIEQGLYERSYPPNGVGGKHDAYTDCVVAGTGLGEESMSAWERGLLVPRISSCTNGGVEQIRALARGEDVEHHLYLRYWAGYTVLFRPALALGGMAAMNAVSLFALACALFAMWWVLSRRTSPLVAAALTLPLLGTSDVLVTPGGSAEHALSLATAFAGVALAAWASTRGLPALFLAAVAAGAVFNFFDLLNNPNLAWVLTAAAGPLCVAFRGGTPRRMALAALSGAAGWMIGFAAAFVQRWTTAALAAGPDAALKQVVENVAVRSGLADRPDDTVVRGLGQGTWANLAYYADMPLARVAAVAVVVAIIALLFVAARRSGARAIWMFATAALPAAVVPLWYEVMTNHSQIHSFFMYRAVPAAIGVVLAAAITALVVTRTAVEGQAPTRRAARDRTRASRRAARLGPAGEV